MVWAPEDTYIQKLKGVLDLTTMDVCSELIQRIIEARHN